MTLAVEEKEARSSNGNAEWAGPFSRLPFHLPDVTPVTLAASNNNLWLYLVAFQRITLKALKI